MESPIPSSIYPCPQCHSTGTPVRVECSPGKTTLSLICANCKNTWEHTRRDPPPNARCVETERPDYEPTEKSE